MVGDRDALGFPRRPGGVDDVREILRRDRDARRILALSADRTPIRIQTDDSSSGDGKIVC